MEATQHRGRVRVRRRRLRRRSLVIAGFVAAALLTGLALVLADAAWRRGQGLAHVDGAEITQQDLLAEARSRKVAVMGAAPALLDAVVARQLLVQEARRRGLAKRPTWPADRKRAVEEALAAALLTTLPPPTPPTPPEIASEIARRPEAYAERRRVILEGLSFAAAADPVSSGTTWDDLDRRLQTARIPHRRDAYIYTTGDAPKPLRSALLTATPGRLISVTGAGQVDVYRVLSVDPAPLEGQVADIEARRALERASRDREVADLLALLRRTHRVQKHHTS